MTKLGEAPAEMEGRMTVQETREHVMERIRMAQRLGGLYHAEACGLLRAMSYDHPVAELYDDKDFQTRYLVGFQDGRMMLEVAARAAGPAVPETAEQGY